MQNFPRCGGLLSVALLAALAGCALAPVAIPEEAAVAPASETPPPRTDLPSVPLSQGLLYDLLLGEIAAQRGHGSESVQRLTSAALRSRDPRVIERAVVAAWTAQRYAEALSLARLWTETSPRASEALEALGTVQLELGQVEEARQSFEAALGLIEPEPERLPTAYLRLAGVMARQSERGGAVNVMRALIARHPRLPEAHLAFAHVAVRNQAHEEAIQSAREALRLRPGWDEAALFCARVLSMTKDQPRLTRFFEDYLRDHPHSRLLRQAYARHLIDLREWEPARRQFKTLVEAAPKDADTLYAVGLLALQLDDVDEADRYLRRHLELQADHDQTRFYLGQIAEKRKRHDEALAWYRGIDEGVLYFDAQLRMAVIVAGRGDLAAARERLAQLTPENDQQFVQALMIEEQLLREARRYPDAYEVLTRGLKLLPDHSDLLYARALVLEKLNRIEELEIDLRHILAREPENVGALNALGYTLADRTDRLQEAHALIEKALALKPDDPFILDSMGWVQYRLGHHGEALKYLRKALGRRHDADISAHLGEVLWVAGEKAEAEAVWRRALQDAPDNETLLGTIRKFHP